MLLTLYFSKDVRLPFQLQRAMATEAEATREARAKVSCFCSLGFTCIRYYIIPTSYPIIWFFVGSTLWSLLTSHWSNFCSVVELAWYTFQQGYQDWLQCIIKVSYNAALFSPLYILCNHSLLQSLLLTFFCDSMLLLKEKCVPPKHWRMQLTSLRKVHLQSNSATCRPSPPLLQKRTPPSSSHCQ